MVATLNRYSKREEGLLWIIVATSAVFLIAVFEWARLAQTVKAISFSGANKFFDIGFGFIVATIATAFLGRVLWIPYRKDPKNADDMSTEMSYFVPLLLYTVGQVLFVFGMLNSGFGSDYDT